MEMAYTSLARSPMEYCGAIWDPVLRRDVNKLERVQLARCDIGKGRTWNCERVVHPGKLGWKELSSRGKGQRLTMLHTILHGELTIPHDAVNIKPVEVAKPRHGSC